MRLSVIRNWAGAVPRPTEQSSGAT